MRNKVVLILSGLLLFSLFGCGSTNSSTESKSAIEDSSSAEKSSSKEDSSSAEKSSNKEETSEEKIFTLVNSYVVEGTKGFDYALEQKLNGMVVNSHTISVRLDNSSETIGSRVENKKELNEDISQGQYTEITATSYYKDNKIATYVDGSWVWKNCQFDEFASVGIDSFGFDTTKVTDINLSTSGRYSILTFKIDDDDASSFLGITKKIKNLSFEIKLTSNLEQLSSFVMKYSQEITNTQFSFVPYYGSVNINLPD